MNSAFKKSALSALLIISATATAGNSSSSNETHSEMVESTQTQTQERHLQWGISEQEYARYEELMKGVRGSISPDTISPLEVLGIHAQNEAERQKYARMWADMMEQDTERVLAFQRAYDAAWREKGNQSLIDISQLQSQAPAATPPATPESVSTGNKMLLATKLSGCGSCDRKIQQLLTTMMVDPSIHLDIYFSDSTGQENSVIRQWARTNNIDAELLRSRRITLNHGQSLMKQYQLDESQLPATFKVNNTGGVKRVE